jgi:N-acetylglucosamine kinase-like BadF-type ATPase
VTQKRSGRDRGQGAVLALDAGGSKTKGLRVERGQVVRSAVAGSANLLSVGTDEASRQLDILLEELGRTGVAAACIGAAGIHTPAAEQQLRRLLEGKLAHAPVRVVHDSRLILAAAGLDSGLAVISGTGSVAWGARPDGVEAWAGGWGYLLGDDGGGFGVARAAVRHALGRSDRGYPPDRLTQRLFDSCGVTDAAALLDAFYADPDRRRWASRAALVFELAEQGDEPSGQLAAEAAQALAGLAATVAARLGLPGPVVLAGGLLMHQPLLEAQVQIRLAARSLTDVRLLSAEPVAGAVRLAEQLAASQG